jgi:CubicO group peptidase (beta-lactamase class C family)
VKLRLSRCLFCYLLSLSAVGLGLPQAKGGEPGSAIQDTDAFRRLEDGLEVLRQQLRIPGLAAGVMKGQQLVWAKGFGYADLEKRIEAAVDTPWHIASVTKTFAAVIVLQLAEEGKLSLDDPLEKFGIIMPSRGVVRVRHILTHTSETKPGTFFRYSGRLWEHLAKVIQEASGKSFKENLIERIIQPLELHDTAPNKESETEPSSFADVRDRAAVPYGIDGSFEPRRSEYGLGFYAAGGLFSSVGDMARYVAALDGGRLLKPKTLEMMFTPHRSPRGRALPHGLGWFCQDVHDTRIVWHFGWHPDHASALLVKVPERELTFMLFANSDKLSQPFNLLRGNVLNSPAALLFLKQVAFPGEEIPEIAGREAVANDIVLKAGGWKPVPGTFQRGILLFCFLSFVAAPFVWTAAAIRRKRRASREGTEPGKRRWGPRLVKIYALLVILPGILFYAALLRAPFLMYWPDLPGWIDGISLEENVFLAFPTVVALLGSGLVALAIPVWAKKYWSLLERVSFSGLAAATAVFILLLDHWHLIGLSYYWSYLLG